MKKINKLFLALLLILAVGACTKDFEEMNTDPNSPVDVPAINIFTNVLVGAVNVESATWMQHTYVGCWCQQWCKCMYIDEDRYQPRDISDYFERPYYAELLDLQIILNKTQANIDAGKEVVTNSQIQGAARVIRASLFMFLTDLWGAIPYTEALQGLEVGGDITPAYDSQESVYMALLDELEQANQLLATSILNFGSGDLFFNGDPVEWRKYANSLKLRLLNRCAGTPWTFTYDMVDPQTDVTTNPGPAAYAGADAAIGTILGSPAQYPIMTSKADNVKLDYPGIPYRNPIFNTLYSRTDQSIAQTMVDMLNDRNDPRIHVYAQPTPDSRDAYDAGTGPLEYVGQQNGREHNSAYFPSISLLGVAIAYDEYTPLYMLTYDETLFTIAEYYMRQGNDALAQQYYEDGIAASMERWGLADGGTITPSYKGSGSLDIHEIGDPVAIDYAAYLAEPLVAWGGTDAEKFQKICDQRWMAILGQGVQAYAEVRRTGFPERIFEYELGAAYYPDMGLPIRLQYALSEETYNSENLEAAKADEKVEVTNEGMFSTNGTESQIWWHTRKNPIPTEKDIPTK